MEIKNHAINMIEFPLFVFTSFQTSLSISHRYNPKVTKNFFTDSNVKPLKKFTRLINELNILDNK